MLMDRFFNHIEDNCDEFSIWSVCPTSTLYSLKTLMLSCNVCTTKYFPYVYWIVLSVSVIYLVISFRELMRRISLYNKNLLRKWRVCGAFMMLSLWGLFIYGCTAVKPDLIILWQTVHGLKLLCRLLFWFVNVLLGANIRDTRVTFVFNVVSSILMLMSVQCVRRVLKQAIVENDVNDLSFFV